MKMHNINDMNIEQLRDLFIEKMREYDYDDHIIETLSNDIHVLRWVNFIIGTDIFPDMQSVFDDSGFHEFLQSQYKNPILFDEMG